MCVYELCVYVKSNTNGRDRVYSNGLTHNDSKHSKYTETRKCT